jgi:hypothetical protein
VVVKLLRTGMCCFEDVCRFQVGDLLHSFANNNPAAATMGAIFSVVAFMACRKMN